MSIRSLKCTLMFLSSILAINPSSGATLSFEQFSDSLPITTLVPGVTFTNAVALKSGISLNEFEFPPRSGNTVVFDDGGAISIFFDSPIVQFAAYFTYLEPLTVRAFDIGGQELSRSLSAYASNLAISGDPGSLPNELIGLFSSNGIKSILISGNPTGSSFTMDDLTYVVGALATVPEPSTALLVASVSLMAFSSRRQRRRDNVS